jgi:hypothetical protein
VTTLAERAVLDAVDAMEKKGRWATGAGLNDVQRVAGAMRMLRAAPPQPDLDVLNARVAEAAVVLRDEPGWNTVSGSPLHRLWDAVDARRAALAPKPRYRVEQGDLVTRCSVYDSDKGRYLTADEVASRLNAQSKEKP